jgi:hypothetical protein
MGTKTFARRQNFIAKFHYSSLPTKSFYPFHWVFVFNVLLKVLEAVYQHLRRKQEEEILLWTSVDQITTLGHKVSSYFSGRGEKKNMIDRRQKFHFLTKRACMLSLPETKVKKNFIAWIWVEIIPVDIVASIFNHICMTDILVPTLRINTEHVLHHNSTKHLSKKLRKCDPGTFFSNCFPN